uniref:MIMI_L478 protein n=1 Tax=Fopius arisanus TaxID=64838 RepID=A0A0C9QKB2_9HYME
MLAGVSNMAYFADENQNHNNSGNSWKSSSSEGSRDMKPFLQDSTTPTITQISTEVDIPKYLEIIADAPGNIREPSIDQYEVPRSIPIASIAGISPDDRRHLEGILSQIGSLTAVAEKSHTLSNSRLVISALQNDSRATFNGRAKLRRKADEAAEIATDERNCNSLSSSISSLRGTLPTTRPSSSVLESQQNITLKNDLSSFRDNIKEPIINSNSTLRLHKTHTLNGKANIPLVKNKLLLNLLRQGSGIDDSALNIVTYTNVNTDSTRVN